MQQQESPCINARALEPARIERAAKILAAARRTKRQIDHIPEDCRPRSLADAYAIQGRLIGLLGHETRGWFAACTNVEIQKMLNLQEPYYARLLADHVFQSPATLSQNDYSPIVLECEFGFEVMHDFTPDNGPYRREIIENAISRVVPTIEVVAGCLKNWPQQDVFSVISDNGTDGALVHGEGLASWRGLDLIKTEVMLTVNGDLVRKGSGQRVLGDPVHSFVWLVNALARAGHPVKAGDIHNTGTATDIYWAKVGDEAVASFGPLGEVALTINE